jgi:hypothetical protein
LFVAIRENGVAGGAVPEQLPHVGKTGIDIAHVIGHHRAVDVPQHGADPVGPQELGRGSD